MVFALYLVKIRKGLLALNWISRTSTLHFNIKYVILHLEKWGLHLRIKIESGYYTSLTSSNRAFKVKLAFAKIVKNEYMFLDQTLNVPSFHNMVTPGRALANFLRISKLQTIY